MIIWLIILIAIVAAIVWLVRSLAPPRQHGGALRTPRRSPALDVLEERYAKGEINRDEYLAKKRDFGD